MKQLGNYMLRNAITPTRKEKKRVFVSCNLSDLSVGDIFKFSYGTDIVIVEYKGKNAKYLTGKLNDGGVVQIEYKVKKINRSSMVISTKGEEDNCIVFTGKKGVNTAIRKVTYQYC